MKNKKEINPKIQEEQTKHARCKFKEKKLNKELEASLERMDIAVEKIALKKS